MNPIWRERIVALVAALVAVWLAYGLAEGALVLPLVAGAIAAAAIFVRLTSMSIDAIVVGGLLFGYIVGNRGFAQLMPVPGLPLLPAEMGLAVASGCLMWRCARDKSLPWCRDALNYALLSWIIVGSARFAFDLPRYGFVAVRDFATVYYVAFFFIVQQLGQDERARRFLLKSLLVASATLPLVFTLFEFFPEFFIGTLTIRGVPLIYFKGDIAPAFLAVGGILLFLGPAPRHQWWARPLAVAMILRVFIGDNRASLLGTVVALAWIARSRFRRFAFVQGGVVALVLLLLVGLATFTNNPWATTKVRSASERALSVVDLTGRFAYRQEESLSKSDNNQFRWVWWRTVVAETLATNPALGLGFGYDLARGFLQEYNPDMAEDFTARSPHSILVTSLGRMGLVGLVIFLWILALVFARTWRVMRDPASEPMEVALWAALWPIAISAGLGVVLEGPMGAVVFWSLLGLATTHRAPTPEAPGASEAAQLEESTPALETTSPRPSN